MSEPPSHDARRPSRDATAEKLEREAFDVLLLLFTVCDANPETLCAELLLAKDLAFEGPHLALLVDHLVMTGHVRRRVGGELFITANGCDYIERAAGKRRSVRYQPSAHVAPGLERWSEQRPHP